MSGNVFERVKSGLVDALAHARGEDVPGMVVHTFPAIADVDVAEIRRRSGLSQERFAESIHVPVGTFRQWEHGRRRPTGPARVLLALLDRDPGLVERLLDTPTGRQ